MVAVFQEVRRVLRKDGTLWLNMGDSYARQAGDDSKKTISEFGGRHGPQTAGAIKSGNNSAPAGLKPKDLIGMPWRVALALQADGWYLRCDIIWSKPNPMPESVTDRPTKGHEYIFLMTKSAKYYYDAEAIKQPAATATVNDKRGNDNGSRKDRDYPGNASNGGTNLGGKSWPGIGPQHAKERDRGEVYEPMTAHQKVNRRSVWEIPTQAFTGWTKTFHLARVEPGDASDGMIHIVFPNCPNHGDLFDSVAKEFYDVHASDNQSHIEHSGDGLSQEHESGSVVSEQHLGDCSGADSLDSDRQEYSLSAIDHNTETHKKGRALETNSPYKTFYETLSHIDDRQELLEFFVRQTSSGENNILPDEMDAHLLDQIPHRTVDKFSSFPLGCNCLIYNTITKKQSHFATFPEMLVKLCILAGTSAKGCCSKCGAPWERQIEVNYKNDTTKSGRPAKGNRHKSVGNDIDRVMGYNERTRRIATTTGWRSTCECNAEIVPCTVMDIFGGSGTTAKVAQDEGRDWIVIELNPKYIPMIERRVSNRQQILNI